MAQPVDKAGSFSVFELFTLFLWIAAAIIFPFGYWINPAWYFVALGLTCIGGFMFFLSRISRRVSEVTPHPDHLEAPCITRDLRGFAGSKMTAEHDLGLGTDGDAD